MTNRVRNGGLAAITGLIVAVVVMGAAAGGWYVWRATQAKSTPTPNRARSPASTPKAAASNGQNGQTNQGNYLVITEWGVRIVLPAALRGDVEYGIRKNVLLATAQGHSIYGDVAYFASKSLAALPAQPNNCGLRPNAHDDLNNRNDPTSYEGGPGISLSRSTEKPSDWAFQIGSFWYDTQKGAAATCYQGSDGSREQSFVSELSAALLKTQAVP